MEKQYILNSLNDQQPPGVYLSQGVQLNPQNTDPNVPTGESLFPGLPLVVPPIPDTQQTTGSWTFPPMYRLKNNSDKNIVWQIMFNEPESKLYSTSGEIVGKIRDASFHPIELNQSSRNLQQQAYQEANKRWVDKRREGYRMLNEEAPKESRVMLATLLEKTKIKRYPILVDPKIDGNRAHCILCKDCEYGVKILSRENVEQNWLSHIRYTLAILFNYLPPGSETDGELFIPSLVLQDLRGVISTHIGGAHPLNKDVSYYMYDLIDTETPFEIRKNRLYSAFQQYINVLKLNNILTRALIVLPSYMVFSYEEMVFHFNLFIQWGYEGLISRYPAGSCIGPVTEVMITDPTWDITIKSKTCKLGNPTAKSMKESKYKNYRTVDLIKFKNFYDEEGRVIDVTQGTGSEEGLAMFSIIDKNNNVLRAVRPKGNFNYRREWFANRDKIIAIKPLYTFRFTNRTRDNVPKEPIGIAFRQDPYTGKKLD